MIRLLRWVRSSGGMALVALVVVIAIYFVGSDFTKTIAIDGLVMACIAYSWNLISGYAGYFSFGQIAFYGAGSYAMALMVEHHVAGWYLAIPLSAIVVALLAIPFGLVLLRLRGIYFALGTLALTVALNLLALDIHAFGQGQGIFLASSSSVRSVYGYAAVAVALAIALTALVGRSRHGLRAMAIRDDEDAIQALGIHAMTTKVLVFAMSAGLAALGGAIAAWNSSFVSPDVAFSSTLNIQAIVSSIVGGVGTVWGPLIGAVGLQWLISWLGPQWSIEVGIGLGVLLILLVVRAPAGIIGIVNRFGLLGRHVVHAPADLPVGPPPDDWLRRHDHSSRPRIDSTRPLLDISGLTVKFRGVTAVSSLDMHVNRDEYLAIIGANGAGKTTLLNALTAFVSHSGGGKILFEGNDLASMSAVKRARAGITRTFQIPRLANSLTVWENVLLGSLLHSSVPDAIARASHAIRAFDLDSVWMEKVDVLGPGYRRRVEMARVIATRPRVVLLDEAMAGMNQEEIASVQAAISSLRGWGVEAIIAVEHVLTAIRDEADRMIALDFGSVIAQGAPRVVLSDDKVVTAYLGTAPSGSNGRNDALAPVGYAPAASTAFPESGVSPANVAASAMTTTIAATPSTQAPLQELRPVSIPGPSTVQEPVHAAVTAAAPAGLRRTGEGIAVRRLQAGYGRVRVLHDIELDVGPGEVIGVLGASGAGKTTLCKAVCGMCTLHDGTVAMLGSRINGTPAFELVRRGLAFVPSSRELFGVLSVEDNLRLGATKMRGRGADASLHQVLSVFPELEQLLSRRATELSGGQQQMTAIARALMRNPRFLVLDEPSTGLAPVVVGRLLESLRQLADVGMGVLVAEQNAHATLQVVDRAYILQEGRVVFHGTYDTLAADSRMASAYLSV